MDGEDTLLTYHPLYGCQDKQRCLPSHRSPCAAPNQQTHTTFLGHATQYDLTPVSLSIQTNLWQRWWWCRLMLGSSVGSVCQCEQRAPC